MIRAILFDCNGIIADDEPIHLKLFQKVLKEEGIRLTRKEYFRKYLAMDDRSCFQDALQVHHRPCSKKIVQSLIQRKAAYYQETIKKELKIFSGVRSFVKAHRKDYVLAVISGALRHEIEWILEKAGIRPDFSVIVSAEDVQRGKPDPQCYRTGWGLLNRLKFFRKNPLKPSECLAIEDSIHGVEAAHKAGMKCLAVTNSYSKNQLRKADAIAHSLEGIRVADLKI